MIPEDNKPTLVTPVVTVPDPSGEGPAEAYVARKVREARASLRRTQIFSTLLALGIIGYVGYVTNTLEDALEPRAAAQIAQGLIADRVEEQGPQLISEMERRIPALIADLPDQALKQMPAYRERLEDQVEADMVSHFTTHSEELGKTFDELLDANKDDIQKMLATGQDPEASREIGLAMEKEFLDFLKSPDMAAGGETILAKMDHSLDALQKAQKRMEHLATAKNLTPQERQARRAIALLAQSIEEKRSTADGAAAPSGDTI